jgi:hypothetical protein
MSESERSPRPLSPRDNEPGNVEKPLEARFGQAQSSTGSFDDPAVYQEFVDSLYSRIEQKLDTEIDSGVAVEIAGFNRLLSVMPRKAVEQNRMFFEMAFSLLKTDQPNLVLVTSIRRDLLAINDRYVGGLSRLLLFASGNTLLNAILSATLTVLLMSFGFMLVMSFGVKLMLLAAGGMQADMRLLLVLKGPSFNELLLLCHAAFLGSLVSIMARIKSFLADPTLTPLMTYVSIVTRPVVAVLVAALVFCTIKSGMISFQAADLDGPNGYYVAWAIGFLCGFSERLAQNIVFGVSHTLSGSTPNAGAPQRSSGTARG